MKRRSFEERSGAASRGKSVQSVRATSRIYLRRGPAAKGKSFRVKAAADRAGRATDGGFPEYQHATRRVVMNEVEVEVQLAVQLAVELAVELEVAASCLAAGGASLAVFCQR